ncbi:hypothetical protein SAY86_025256 [Trapa natans]|uniref:beta-glucosidase n=1 Tax=Trapa natans TaxID=22666 RepID=A0AAN7RIT4_TRANT|nr:hypothetical protein SAY86_025256 [Trapa natans]
MGRKSITPTLTGLVILMCCSAVLGLGSVKHEELDTARYMDPSSKVEDRVQDLLKRMTLAEKIGQMMTQTGRLNASKEVMKKLFIGIHNVGIHCCFLFGSWTLIATYQEFTIHIDGSGKEEGHHPTSGIHDAVSRILRVKFSMGRFESPLAADNSLAYKLGCQDSFIHDI